MSSADPTSHGTIADDRSAWDQLRALWYLLFSRQGYVGPPSDHFDGRHFHNQDRIGQHGLSALLRWRWQRWTGGVGAWPDWTSTAPGPPPRRKVEGEALRVTLVNHSTVLIQTAGVNILADPIWSERASPVSWAGPRRRRPPGIRFGDLPPIDIVAISHNHYDHLDLPTLRALLRDHHPRFVTCLGNAALLARGGIGPVTEFDWWQETPAAGSLKITCVPAQHFAARSMWDRNRTLWCGFVIHGQGGPIYFAADTGFGSHFEQIVRRFGPMRVALLPIGAHLPRWFMGPVHMSPQDAVRAHHVLQARTSVPIHFGTFPAADDAAEQPLDELKSALTESPEAARGFRVLEFGEGVDVP